MPFNMTLNQILDLGSQDDGTPTRPKSRPKYYIHHGLRVSRGNRKLGNNTLILNITPAKDCVSRRLGFCRLNERCYALKAERLYPQALAWRQAQREYWDGNSVAAIADTLIDLLYTKRTLERGRLTFVDGEATFRDMMVPLWEAISYVRFNESGDFRRQADVRKLDMIARRVRRYFPHIKFYGYTARRDLNFKEVSFIVKGTEHDAGNAGIVRIRPQAWIDDNIPKLARMDARLCPGSCQSCTICKEKSKSPLYIPLH
jgi:hypothetical protein